MWSGGELYGAQAKNFDLKNITKLKRHTKWILMSDFWTIWYRNKSLMKIYEAENAISTFLETEEFLMGPEIIQRWFLRENTYRFLNLWNNNYYWSFNSKIYQGTVVLDQYRNKCHLYFKNLECLESTAPRRMSKNIFFIEETFQGNPVNKMNI
jgi:hypothetical protein